MKIKLLRFLTHHDTTALVHVFFSTFFTKNILFETFVFSFEPTILQKLELVQNLVEEFEEILEDVLPEKITKEEYEEIIEKEEVPPELFEVGERIIIKSYESIVN